MLLLQHFHFYALSCAKSRYSLKTPQNQDLLHCIALLRGILRVDNNIKHEHKLELQNGALICFSMCFSQACSSRFFFCFCKWIWMVWSLLVRIITLVTICITILTIKSLREGKARELRAESKLTWLWVYKSWLKNIFISFLRSERLINHFRRILFQCS